MATRNVQQVQYGDFQTPDALATQTTALLASIGMRPRSIVEPTFGLGSFVVAAAQTFAPHAAEVFGLEINADLIEQAKARLLSPSSAISLEQGDFFVFDWTTKLRALPEPILIIGNPPWVTSAGLGSIRGTNLPKKENFQGHTGLDAKTGKSNFDIAEWMVIRLLESLGHKRGTLAMLMKTSVARRALTHAWKSALPIVGAQMYRIDGAKHFRVAASACLLVCELGPGPVTHDCTVAHLDRPDQTTSVLGWREGMLLADVKAFDRTAALLARPAVGNSYRWRSGVKHDCSAAMELSRRDDGVLVNGLGEDVDIESDYLYPMLKSSDVAAGRTSSNRYMLVPQRRTGEDTASIETLAPRTWKYLCSHADALDSRGSSIYRNRPRFSVFGVGDYTFAPWKVVTSGLYKRLGFVVVGSVEDRPIVLDDTCYHLSCSTEAEATALAAALNTSEASAFFAAFVFWDAKRPITVELLRRLDLTKLLTLRGSIPSRGNFGLFGA